MRRRLLTPWNRLANRQTYRRDKTGRQAGRQAGRLAGRQEGRQAGEAKAAMGIHLFQRTQRSTSVRGCVLSG